MKTEEQDDLEFGIRLGSTVPWPKPGQEGYQLIMNEDGKDNYGI